MCENRKKASKASKKNPAVASQNDALRGIARAPRHHDGQIIYNRLIADTRAGTKRCIAVKPPHPTLLKRHISAAGERKPITVQHWFTSRLNAFTSHLDAFTAHLEAWLAAPTSRSSASPTPRCTSSVTVGRARAWRAGAARRSRASAIRRTGIHTGSAHTTKSRGVRSTCSRWSPTTCNVKRAPRCDDCQDLSRGWPRPRRTLWRPTGAASRTRPLGV